MLKRIEAIISGSGEVTTREAILADLNDGEVRIKVHTSLISPGTEMAGVKDKRANPNTDKDPVVFGYANAGEVIEVTGDCKGIELGMRVAAMGGRANHANYANVPVNLVVPIPDSVTYAQASYACLGATALQAVRRTSPQLGEYGLVLGLGIVGNLVSQLLQISGARVLGWESLPARIKMAQACNINQSVNFMKENAVEASQTFAAPYGNDLAVFAFGGNATKAFNNVKDCMKKAPDTHQMGRIVLVGGCTVELRGGASSGNLDIRAASRTGAGYHDKKYEYGQDYPNAFVPFTTQRNLREIIQLMLEKRLVVDPMTTHRFPLEEVGKATDLLINEPDTAMGCILDMSH